MCLFCLLSYLSCCAEDQQADRNDVISLYVSYFRICKSSQLHYYRLGIKGLAFLPRVSMAIWTDIVGGACLTV
jgi:hypothetical protein